MHGMSEGKNKDKDKIMNGWEGESGKVEDSVIKWKARILYCQLSGLLDRDPWLYNSNSLWTSQNELLSGVLKKKGFALMSRRFF